MCAQRNGVPPKQSLIRYNGRFYPGTYRVLITISMYLTYNIDPGALQTRYRLSLNARSIAEDRTPVVNFIKHFAILIYDSRVILTTNLNILQFYSHNLRLQNIYTIGHGLAPVKSAFVACLRQGCVLEIACLDSPYKRFYTNQPASVKELRFAAKRFV